MRLIILAALSALFLTSCQSLYDDAARDECRGGPARQQMNCRDRADEARWDQE